MEPMKSVACTFCDKRELMHNCFRADGSLSVGMVEGLNKKLELITGRSFGFRTQEAYETALNHNLGALPEPKYIYGFF